MYQEAPDQPLLGCHYVISRCWATWSIETKEGLKADTEAKVLKDDEEKTVKMKEAMATHEFLAGVHADCDWLLTNFDTRPSEGVPRAAYFDRLPFEVF